MPTPLSRRTFTAGSLAVVVGGTLVPARLIPAQEGAFAGLDLRSLDFTVTADGFGGVPVEIAAGRYLLTVTPEEGLESWGAEFIQPPEGLMAEQLLLELQGATEVVPQDAASPEADSVSEFPPAGAPLVAYEALFAGGAMGLPGSSEPVRVVIDLPPGEWILWAGGPSEVQAPLVFQATGEMPGTLPEPEADIDVTLADGSIRVEGALTAGDHILRIAHEGEQPHHVELMRGPDDMTAEDVDAALRLLPAAGATTDDLAADPDTDLSFALIAADQSMGVVQWVPVSLEAGTYVALCFFPMREDATPHALHGEYTVFTVE